MESLEFNKIAGAALSALLLAFGSGTIPGLISGEHEGGEAGKPGYVLPVKKAVATSGAAEAKFDPAKVVAAVAKASAESGQDDFKPCSVCHSVDKGGKTITGPNLYGIVGRDVGSVAGFAYSPAMKAKGGKWTYDALATYIHDPAGAVKDNKMAFKGIDDDLDLADVLAYLRTLADSPAPLPK